MIVGSGGNQSPGEVRLYENNVDGEFSEMEDGKLITMVGRYEGLSCFDYDKDGDLDIFISNYFNNDNLLYNNNDNDNHWINIALVGMESNSNAIGTKVYVKATIDGVDVWQMREIIAQSGHVVQGSLKTHFGVGDATIIDSVMIVWPTQKVQIYESLNTDQFAVLSEGPIQSSIETTSKIKQDIFFQVFPNPMREETEISFILEKPAVAKLDILTMEGRLVERLFSGKLPAGTQNVEWAVKPNGVRLAAGFYIISFVLDGFILSEKILLSNAP